MAFDPRLGTAFNFDETDLEANGAGWLTPDQDTIRRNTVRVHERGARRGGLVLGVAIGAAAVAIAVGLAKTPGSDPGVAILAYGMLAAIAGLALGFRRHSARATRAMAAAELAHAEGAFSWESDLNSRWWGIIGDARFPLSRDQEELLVTGADYRVHYLTGDHAWVMSIERL